MWYLLAAEVVLLVVLIVAVDLQAWERQRRIELQAARVRVALQRIERDR